MYTRVYRGRGQPLPENYNGTAFVSEEDVAPVILEGDEATSDGKESPAPAQEAGEESSGAPREGSERKEAHAEGEGGKGGDAWQTELLLVALCALLIECEEPDGRLLSLLLLLLLSGST